MITEALFIGGRAGAGKTSVGFEVHAQLSAADIAHCLIDGDFLDMAHPPPWEYHLAERNLAAMWANCRDLGYRRLVYTNTACVLPDVLDQLTTAMGGAPRVIAVLLTCTDATARKRLSQREIGSAFERHFATSRVMAATLDSAARAHRIPTDGRNVSDIAGDVLDLTGWLGP
jgi:hypothetical protein